MKPLSKSQQLIDSSMNALGMSLAGRALGVNRQEDRSKADACRVPDDIQQGTIAAARQPAALRSLLRIGARLRDGSNRAKSALARTVDRVSRCGSPWQRLRGRFLTFQQLLAS